MDNSRILAINVVALSGPALAFAVGALVAGFATLTAWSTAYMNANPAVGGVSGGSPLVVTAMFVVGTAVMFLAACDALVRIQQLTK